MTSSDNPLLTTVGLPKFHLIQPEHIEPAIEEILEKAEKRLSEIESNLIPTWSGLIEPLEELGILFEYGWDPIGHLLNVRNSKELREEQQKMLPKVVQFGLRLNQSRPIYDGLFKIRDGTEWDKLDDAQHRVINLKIRGAELAGVGLSGEAKKRFNEISTELSKLGHDFSNNVLDSTKAYEIIITEKSDTDGWSETLLQLGSQIYNQVKNTTESTPEDGPWRLTLEAPIIVPFLRYSKRRDHREKMLKAYVSRADSGDWDNKPLITKILRLRKEKAGLLDYDNYAEMSLTEKMAPSVEAVRNMFNELFNASKPHQLNEFNELEKIAKEGNQIEVLEHWDIAYWSERIKENRFDLSEDELRPYFPLPKVLEGMFTLTKFLFGVKIKEADGDAPVWHPDVRYFKIYEDESQIGSFYLDAYSRPEEKRGGAWMNNCLARRKLNNKVRLPVVYLNANGTPPVGDTPSLMSFEEVTTLFHEFGHGLQGMLTKINYSDVSGINGIEWDAVEIISQFLENWCYHEPTMRSISGHWETDEALPDKHVKKLREARVFRAASAMIRQLEFGMTDMELHSSFNPFSDESPFEVHMRVAEKTHVLPPLEEDHLLCAFNHIFAGGYAAGYYSYKWAEVLSADIYSEFEKTGLENEDEIKTLGLKLRESFLALGGSVEPMKIFRDFMGRDPSSIALLKQNNLL
jgi:oligopeptidase A